ncbi:MAG: dicarboxylate/amino acid:cation symporter [bacterium]|nr:dicarboxylate/amino acid:cation symporter [bacterium]
MNDDPQNDNNTGFVYLLKSVPGYVWTFTALILGISFGGMYSEMLTPVANGTTAVIKAVITVVPILIFAALSPAVATLVKRGLAGKFASSVIAWYVLSSAISGLLGLSISSVLFNIPFSTETHGAISEAGKMLKSFGEQSGASFPLLAIVGAIFVGIISVWIKPLYDLLVKIENGVKGLGSKIGYVLVPVIGCLGISIGVNFGARIGMGHYFVMSFYTFILCLVWFLFYTIVILKWIAKKSFKRMMKEYYIPTAVFSAATCSSLATLPINLSSAKKYGVRDEVADFVIPFGAVANMNASTLAYVAYAPFILSYIYGIEISWTILFIAWPAIVLFTIAAPGLPAGMGTALWSGTLFISMLGIEEPVKSSFITTWIALSGGLPDMFRTATNCTGDGFTAILFDKYFDRFSRKKVVKGDKNE